MKKTISFGKIDYFGKGRKTNEVTVHVELQEKNEGLVFTASESIWNNRHTNCYSCGQNLDEINKFISDETFKKIYIWWTLYHLNDLHAGCIHQRAFEKEEYKKHAEDVCPICQYKYGSAWNFEPIPENDLKEIKDFLS